MYLQVVARGTLTEALWGGAVRCPAIGACVARTQVLRSSMGFEVVGVRDASVAYAPLTYIVKLLIPTMTLDITRSRP